MPGIFYVPIEINTKKKMSVTDSLHKISNIITEYNVSQDIITKHFSKAPDFLYLFSLFFCYLTCILNLIFKVDRE